MGTYAVYDESSGQLQEGETAESFFIQIQAAYELLMDRDQRRQYDLDHKYNPLKVSIFSHFRILQQFKHALHFWCLNF